MDDEQNQGTANPEASPQPGGEPAPGEKSTGVIYPKCGACGDDPLKLWRLRYDWPDGVLAETIFCGNCRAVIAAQIVYVPQKR